MERLLLRPRIPENEKPLSAAALRTPASERWELEPADDAAANQINRARERRAAGRLGKDPFGLGEQLNRIDDLVVGHRSA